MSSVAASADAKSSCRKTDATWSWTTRNAAAPVLAMPGSSPLVIFCSTTTTPWCTYMRPSSAVVVSELAHPRSASWPCTAPCASPMSMSSVDNATRVSMSAALRASCQASTVAISDVVMV
ncbi:Uncharacterised protein [Mycobacterium tuberculosis]|uniref:Uncharacterized protein n=1 Tax=Mycobacterium tuberculosis TaxID=1773 RepID=A0A916LG00_MYCTX|nr:Uncharacterised protein [Mycobacterium tuberculosis]